jgi:hypothetical protein
MALASPISQPPSVTLLKQPRTGCTMDCPVDGDSTLQFGIGCVDDSLGSLGGDVADNDSDRQVRARRGQSPGLLVVVTGCPRVAPAILVVPMFIEAHHGRLRGDAAVFEPGSLDRPNEVFSPLKIGCLEHHLVVGDVEMAVQKCDTEAVETFVLSEHEPYLF